MRRVAMLANVRLGRTTMALLAALLLSQTQAAACLAPGWAPTGAMAVARGWALAATLHDGRVLVFGGSSSNFSETATAELYDPASGRFTATGPMIHHVQWASVTVLQDGRVLVAGGDCNYGCNSGWGMRLTQLYDPVSGTLSQAGDLHVGRLDHSATLLDNGKVLVTGGSSCADSPAPCGDTTSAELFSPQTGAWTLVAPMNVGRAAPTTTLLQDGRVLVAGGECDNDPGCGGGFATATAEVYDPVLDSWRLTSTPMTVARTGAAAARLANGDVMVIGGSDTKPDTYETDIYHPLLDAWSPGGLGPDAPALGAGQPEVTQLANGDLLELNGASQSNTTFSPRQATWLYRHLLGTWVYAGQLLAPRALPILAALPDGSALVAGGLDCSYNPLTSAERWTPPGQLVPTSTAALDTPCDLTAIPGG